MENLPVLCSGSALRFLLTRVDNWNSSNEVDIVNYQDPKEFLNRLKFHEQINNIEDYGPVSYTHLTLPTIYSV